MKKMFKKAVAIVLTAAMAMTGAEVLTDPGLLAEIKEEFRQMIESGNY